MKVIHLTHLLALRWVLIPICVQSEHSEVRNAHLTVFALNANWYYNANIGIGDLLVVCLFIVAAYKGFGKKGVVSSVIMTGIFGVLIPSCAPLIVAAFVRDGISIVVPVQLFFGPVAFLTYLWP